MENKTIRSKNDAEKCVKRILDRYKEDMEGGYLEDVFKLQNIVGVPIPEDIVQKGYEVLIKKPNCCYGPIISKIIELKRRTGVNIPKNLVLKAYEDRIKEMDEFCEIGGIMSNIVEYNKEAATECVKGLETLVKETGIPIPKNIILGEYKRQQKNLRYIRKTGDKIGAYHVDGSYYMYVEEPIFKMRVLKKLLDKKKIIRG